ncbi:TolB family protein [Sorangium sp. So ce542]|uniref:TolB family protein n=1 Tax=Sorangium sp. So ce542 TaxID=3133316 RepID=UPI003F621B30
MVKAFFASMTFGAALLGCAQAGAPSPPPAEAESEGQAPLTTRTKWLVQRGARLLLLGVTSDNHALYQEGERVYATALEPGATRQLVAQVPPGNTAFVYTVGKVAFCWTNPDRSLPGFGVSPLVVWSAASGPREASAASPIGTFATSASADGRSVLFPTHGNADGSVGDVELASTDMSERTTLLAAVPMGFPQGYCRPFAAFVGRHGRSHPVALHCEGGASSATLSSWEQGERVDLLGGVATPPFFSADAGGGSFFTTLAGSGHPVVVSDDGEVSALDEVRSRIGFFAKGGSVVYTAQTEAGLELRRAAPGDCPSTETIADEVGGILTVLAGSKVITDAWASPDGSKVAFFTQRDPATGLSDVALADARGGAPPLSIDPQTRNVLGGPPFSADSKHVLFARIVDLTTGTAPLLASSEGGVRQFSDDGGWSYLPAVRGLVSFNDNTHFDAEDFARSTADLKVVDLSREPLKPRLIAPGANLTYFSSHGGRRLAFTTDLPDTTAGLYSAEVGK